MPGIIYRVIPKQVVPFQASQNIDIARGVDVSQYREASLVVRWHVGTALSAATLNVYVYPDAPTAEDSGDVFFTTTSLLTTAINTTAAPIPGISWSGLNTPFPGFVRVRLNWSASGSGQVVISADLIAKS